MSDIIDRLEEGKRKVEASLSELGNWGSQKKEVLTRIKDALSDLILTYSQSPSPTLSSTEVERILNQQYGFAEQKAKIIESVKIRRYTESRGINLVPPIICLVGPAGVGKTTFAQVLAQALNKQFFSLALGGVLEPSFLLGTEPSSSGNEMGQLAKALIEKKVADPLILLDEIDKTGSPFKTGIHSVLSTILDSTQNQKVYEYFLGVDLDFSQVTFVATANDLSKIPSYLRSRLEIIELKEYTIEQKKEIAQKIIQKELEKSRISTDLLKITDESLDNLINKTHEKGVRQLKLGLKKFFHYGLLKWAEQTERGQSEAKIIITSDLADQIIPQDFANIDQEEDKEQQLERLQKELAIFQREKTRSEQNKLAVNKINALRIIQQALNKANLTRERLDSKDYEERVNRALSLEEIEAIREEILLNIAKKSTGRKVTNNWDFNDCLRWLEKKQSAKDKENKDNQKDIRKIEEQLKEAGQWKENWENQLNNFQKESIVKIEELQKEIKNLQKENKVETKELNWTISKNPWFIIAIISFFLWAIYGMLKIKKFFSSPRKTK